MEPCLFSLEYPLTFLGSSRNICATNDGHQQWASAASVAAAAVVAAGEEGARARCELTHLLSMDISWTGTLVRSPWLAFAVWSLALN